MLFETQCSIDKWSKYLESMIATDMEMMPFPSESKPVSSAICPAFTEAAFLYLNFRTAACQSINQSLHYAHWVASGIDNTDSYRVGQLYRSATLLQSY